MQLLTAFLLLVLIWQEQTAVVRAGSMVDVRLDSAIQTATANAGDAIIATLMEPLRAAGQIVVPAGSQLSGRVETVERASASEVGRVRLVFRQIRLPDGRIVSTFVTNSFSASAPNRTRRHILYMGIGGAAGAFIGGKAARTAGILGGLLGGFAIASNTGDSLPDLSLKRGQQLRLILNEDLSVGGPANPATR